MNLKSSLLAASLATLSALTFAPAPAAAGSLDGAALACYIDTYAYDQLSTDYCAAAWTPGTANIQTIAHFEVVGLPGGSYSYTWNLPCGGSSTCDTSIRARPEQTILGQVTVRNLATGEQRTLSAYAEYLNGWD